MNQKFKRTEQIDFVLTLLNEKYFNDDLKTVEGQKLDDIDILLNEKGISMKKHYLESILHQLLTDGYISNYDNHWKPTWKGAVFLENGGYRKNIDYTKNLERSMKWATWIMAIGATLLLLWGVFIYFCPNTMCK